MQARRIHQHTSLLAVILRFLDAAGIVVLEDDKQLQNAENLVPIVNSAWIKDNPKAADALNKLSEELTTGDHLAW